MWVEDLRATGLGPVPQSAPGGVGRCHPARRPAQTHPHRLAPASAPGRQPASAAEPCLLARSPASRRRQALRFLGAAARPGLLPPPRGAAVPQPGARRWPAHLHLFAEGARPRHCQRPGAAAAAAATPVAPASRPRHGPAAGSRVAFLRSVNRSCLPTLSQRHRAGCSRAHVASTEPQPGSWSAPAAPATETPSFPPALPPAPPPPPPLNSSNSNSPAEPRAQAAALPPP